MDLTTSVYDKIPKDNMEPSYEEKRQCMECGTPIPDQEHASRKFCEKYYDQHGQVHDCKTNYHTNKNKPVRAIYSHIIRDQKFYTRQINEMTQKKGYDVTTDDLNAYDIILTDSMSFKLNKDGTAIFQFLNYSILSNPVTNHHKITANE